MSRAVMVAGFFLMVALLSLSVVPRVDAGIHTQEFVPEACNTAIVAGVLDWCELTVARVTPDAMRGFTALPNPAVGQLLIGTEDDPLAAFARRPMDHYIIPEGGLYLDPSHDGPHYGLDYANPEDYLNGRETYFYPIGPGYVTARADCMWCFVDGDAHGRVTWKWPRYNFGWGGLVLVETPLLSNVSIYVLYAHLARDFVSLGDYVTPDDVIGVVGSTGYSQEFHLHVEIRFGPPGRFWNADFSEYETLDSWMGTMFANPAHLILPESHPAFLTGMYEWLALQPAATPIP